MPTIQSILEKESSNTHHIFFYREGVFYKAYERSAYLFVTNYKPFMVKKRFVKAADREIVSVGFPTNSINSYLPKDQLHENGNEVEISLNISIDTAEYDNWWSSIEASEPQPKEKAIKISVIPSNGPEAEALMKIKMYPIEGKTPLECMQFLSDVKKSL